MKLLFGSIFPLGLAISTGAAIALLKIILIDIILSGDNAVVIAMATRKLQKDQQNRAIFWGTAGAVILRIILAIVIVALLKVPFVNIIGGLLLLWIAYKVLVGGDEEVHIQSSNGILKAIGTIIVADAVMSLDNVVALAGAANGHIGMIALGVAISIPVMIFGSKLIVGLMNKYNWISYIGSGILAWTAGEMLLKDEHLLDLLNLSHGLITYIISAIITIFVLALGYYMNKKTSEKQKLQHAN
ncbi:TerC family protein [Heyndrickxia ginsengihumi]|uniref:TerC family protein n=1 Tax=Heyndrickxia ginsengihumi TaxID=363870 RepID=A0A6M0P2K2_9BACI|nr:TerC family protein [Heyndrickxia ginsengihumi]MBE6184859.1 TerC family protein [Bacillus sp. (in: firmicutes)]MCM3023637.1 TerC family protein [Heyndrickxia ginsengihumi]NEY18902.1 TerC family protein [Heyndrickxia ginsengihumi]